MKKNSKLLLTALVFGFFTCKQTGSTSEDHSVCNSLSNKKVVLKIAKSILDKDENDQIWNLSEIDTTKFLSVEDYFTNSNSKNGLVLMGGLAGTSAGTANNLLILFSCSDSLRAIWSGQISEFARSDIADLNGDGVKEIVVVTGSMWMGECHNSYSIFNFKEGRQNYIYSARSKSVLDCGNDTINEAHKQGDTLAHQFDCSLLKVNNSEFKIRQIETIKIHNGGANDNEILNKLLVKVDTTEIKIN